VFEAALGPLFEYVQRKNLAEEAISEYMAFNDVWERYPPGWSEHAVSMLALLASASTPEQCRALDEVVRAGADDRAAELVAGWADAPWRFCPLEFVEQVRGSLLTLRLMGELPADWSGELYSHEITVYSPSLVRHYRRGERRWLVLTAPQFGVFYAYGLIIPVDAFDEAALFAFARFFESDAEYEQSNVVPPLAGSRPLTEPLADVITRRLVYFLQLPDYRELPAQFDTLRGRDMCAAVALLHGTSERVVASFWQETLRSRFPDVSFSVHGPTFAIVLVDNEREIEARVLVSSSDKRAFLQTMDIESYAFFRESLTPLVDFPEEPQQRTPLLVWSTVEHILAPVDELGMLSETVAEQEPDAVGAFGLSPQEIATLTAARAPDLPGVLRMVNPQELRQNAETRALSETPVLKLAQFLADRYLASGEIPSTAGGYVKPAVVHEALAAGVVDADEWHRDYYKRHRPPKELDCREFLQARERLEGSGFLERTGKTIRFAPPAYESSGDPVRLYHTLLSNAFCNYRWDVLAMGTSLPGLFERGALLLAALRVLSGPGRDWIEVSHLVEAYSMLTGTAGDESSWIIMSIDLEIALIDRLAKPFGLAERKRSVFPREDERESLHELRPLALYDAVFELRGMATGTHRSP